MPERAKFFLIDGHALIYRAYYAIPNLTAPDGRPTGAIHGFLRKLLKIHREDRPDALAIVFDAHGPTFRDELSPAYKATRQAMPEDLSIQIALIQELLTKLGCRVLSAEGFEADDVIASIATRAADEGCEVLILSGDKDLAALAGKTDRGSITLLAPARELDKERVLDRDGVIEKFGVAPEQIPDYLALVGDSSDNIEGVPGVGAKTAAKLLKDFGSIEGILAATEKLTPKACQSFENNRPQLDLARKLVALRRDLPLPEEPLAAHFATTISPTPDAIALFDALGFKGLRRDFEALAGKSPATAETTDEAAASEAPTPTPAPATASLVIPKHILLDPNSLAGYLERASSRLTAFDTETTSLAPHDAELVGVSFAPTGMDPAYLPLSHAEGMTFDGAVCMPILKRYLEDAAATKCGHNVKFDLQMTRAAGIAARGFAFDSLVAAALLHPLRRSQSLDALALELFGLTKISFDDLGSGGQFRAVPIARAAEYSCEDAVVTLALHDTLSRQLDEHPDLARAYREIEHPLIEVLADMEWRGIHVDRARLDKLAVEFRSELDALRARAIESAGLADAEADFNPDSPKQVAAILFEKLKLPAARKTKTGYSTDQETLEELRAHHELPGILLEYREVAKLLNTYVESLPALIHQKTGRLHTNFSQARTATGRLSSTNPNLQNIPVRSDRGRSIRSAFTAPPGRALVAADYSQIEFRIAAYFSKDPTLLHAFESGLDLHAVTAERLFGDAKDPMLRRRAKTVNFGILYGQSAFGLARQLGISRKEAAAMIDGYFAAFPKLRSWMDGVIEEARATGYVATLFGRRRPVEEIRSRNHNLRAAGERIAVNTPVQGTAADIIKIAMARARECLSRRANTGIVLQVHDELVVETDRGSVDEVKEILRESMTKIPPLEHLLEVNAGSGADWLEAGH